MPTVGVAVLAGLAGIRRDFLRTPKLARRHTVAGALCAASGEAAMVLALLSAAVAIGNGYPQGGADVTAWRVMLLVMSVPFACALGLSLLGVGATVQGIPYAPAPAVARGSQER